MNVAAECALPFLACSTTVFHFWLSTLRVSNKYWGAGREVMGRGQGGATATRCRVYSSCTYSPWTTEQNIRMQRYGDGDGRLFLRCDLQLHAQITFLSQLRTCYTRLEFMQSTSASVNSAVR